MPRAVVKTGKRQSGEVELLLEAAVRLSPHGREHSARKLEDRVGALLGSAPRREWTDHDLASPPAAAHGPPVGL
ncbi:MAG TPA: hypothetical protein VEJ23_05095 [Solirubrobacteraceae bacterium]|nr:hypothetical protein [Solirubrobacteraceae bacterium]